MDRSTVVTPLITIIIPTRERAGTLLSSLKTCVTQDYENLRILVSDNASSPETRDVVSSYEDPRIYYVNTGRRVSMTENWEFALSHVDQGFVCFLGDDDGVMPNGVEEMAALLTSSGAPALIWPLASYYWPDFYDTSFSNCISMRIAPRRQVTRMDSRKTLSLAAQFRTPHYSLPSPYWGVVQHDALKRAVSGGRVFHSITPDLYAGAAVAAVITSFCGSDRILTLSGASAHSNGASQLSGDGGAASPSSEFENENTLPFHPDLDFAPSVPVMLAEVLMQVRDHVDRAVPLPDLKRMINAVLANPDFVFSPAVQPRVIDSLRATAERHGLLDHLEQCLRREQKIRWGRRGVAASANLLLGNPLYDCSSEGATNIYDATVIAHRVLNSQSTGWQRARVVTRGRTTKVRRAVQTARHRLA